MVKLNVLELLEKQGKTKYWLWNQLNMGYGNFHKMIHNETRSIQYEKLDIMCSAFNCTPGDLFKYEPDKEQD